MKRDPSCPVCDGESVEFDRRHFIKVAGATAAAAALPRVLYAAEGSNQGAPETLVKKLYESLSDAQKKEVAFAWDHQDEKRGLLRTHVSNNWQITKHEIRSDFLNKDQQEICRAIYEGLFQPDWVKQIDKQLQDDTHGKPWGAEQSIAMFGKPGDKFEMVMTGRHLTVRVDGNSIDSMAFGGPVFHGHQATQTTGLNEKVGHPGNIWWPQALEANKVFEMLDGKQREKALLAQLPAESSVGFRGKDGKFPGITVADLSADQKAQLQKAVKLVFEPYRNTDRDEVNECLNKQGGLDACSLAFYAQGDIGDDGIWDNWRLEGPSFVFYFRGSPHVHMWVNIGSDPAIKLNAIG